MIGKIQKGIGFLPIALVGYGERGFYFRLKINHYATRSTTHRRRSNCERNY